MFETMLQLLGIIVFATAIGVGFFKLLCFVFGP